MALLTTVATVVHSLPFDSGASATASAQVTGKTNEGIRWTLSRAAIEGWHSGTMSVDALEPDQIEKTEGCQSSARIEMRGASALVAAACGGFLRLPGASPPLTVCAVLDVPSPLRALRRQQSHQGRPRWPHLTRWVVRRPRRALTTSPRLAAAGGTGVFDDFQIGSVAIDSVDETNKGQCTATTNCDQPVNEMCTAQKPQESQLSYWYNGAGDLNALYSHENIVVVDDLPDDLPGGPAGFRRSCALPIPIPAPLPLAGTSARADAPQRARAGTLQSPVRRCTASRRAAWCRWR